MLPSQGPDDALGETTRKIGYAETAGDQVLSAECNQDQTRDDQYSA